MGTNELPSPYVQAFFEKFGFSNGEGFNLALLKAHNLPPGNQTGPLMPLGVDFDPEKYTYFETECAEVSEGLGSVFIPVANVGKGVAILVAGEYGHYVIVGFAGPGVLYAGRGIGETLTRIVHGYPTPVLLPRPSSQVFEYDINDWDTVIEFERGKFLEKMDAS